jgi:hypothetical protein
MKYIFSAGAKPADLYIIAPQEELIHGFRMCYHLAMRLTGGAAGPLCTG